MNIFYTSRDPEEAARNLANRHVVSQTLETAQLLSTAHRVLDGPVLPDGREQMLYKATHINHPSSKWARETNNNYNWLFIHFHALLNEYTYRYENIHACEKLLPYLRMPPINIPIGPLTQPPCAMDEQYKISDDSLVNYRNYYRHGKKHLHSWKKREQPAWMTK